jgi:hypothetical protein
LKKTAKYLCTADLVFVGFVVFAVVAVPVTLLMRGGDLGSSHAGLLIVSATHREMENTLKHLPSKM